MKPKILIIEDEKKIARFIQLELEHEGYITKATYDGRSGIDIFNSFNPDLIILDLMLPNLNGIEVCRRIRQTSSLPIIMLTAKDGTMDKVMGLDMGADDYMTKPFEIEELLARIRRRLKVLENSQKASSNSLDCITHGKLQIFKDAYQVKYDSENIELTKKEFQLLLHLVENKEHVLTREQILNKVWGYDFIGDTNIVDVYIRYIRSKIDNHYNIKLIHTVWGIGYVVKKEVEETK